MSAPPAGADQVVAQAAASPAPSPSPTPTPPPHLLQVSGFADAGYTSASIASGETPAGGGKSITAGFGAYPYVFDTLNQDIQFHNFNLQASYGGPIGGKVEASFGDDASLINSYPKSTGLSAGSDIDLTQAYLALNSGQFTLIAGKFETLAGAEVIEAPSNYNFSRSILFGYAVPFTHTGARLTWAYSGALSLIAGVNKGWDTSATVSNNGQNFPDSGSLTIEGGAAWNPSKVFGITVQGYTGRVEEGSSFATPGLFVVTPARPQKSLVDTVITFHATPSLTLVVNGDAGQQTNSNYYDQFGNIIGYGTGTWSGVAGYVNYSFSSIWSATLRAEYLGDYGGLRTGISQRWGEGTATLQWTPNSNVIVRAEIRGDKSNQLFFKGGPLGTGYNSNSQFGLETIVKWP